MSAKVRIYALSTCSHCAQAKEFLDERKVAYDPVSEIGRASCRERV